MTQNEEPIELTPEQFELEVRKLVRRANANLKAFEAKHREQIQGVEGIYEIDVTVRFEAFGAEYLTLIECKQHKNPIKRDVVQTLYDKIRTTGAHKGMIFATTTFQRGAIEYAKAHGIALVRMVEGKPLYETKAFGTTTEPPSWVKSLPYVGYFYSLTDDGYICHTLVSSEYSDSLNDFLGF